MKPLDLAAIGNCTIAALVDTNARYVWFCHPRLDGDPVFAALVDGTEPERGFFDVQVRDLARSHQRYRTNTAVLETEMEDAHGAKLRVIDFAPRMRRFGRMFRPPMIVRRIEPVAGRCRIRVRLRPTFDYGRQAPTLSIGSNHVRYVSGGGSLRATTDMPVSFLTEEVEFLLDRPVHLFIGSDDTIPERLDGLCREFLEDTTTYWQDWVRSLAVPFEWQDAVIRAAVTLKLCSFEDSGAIVAALTTSIPESADSGRNWDYRYCWLRDSFFTVNALNRLGATATMESYIRYLLNVVLVDAGAPLRPLYPIVPGRIVEEHPAEALKGFLGMGPVRVGNGAEHQRQNDVYGSLVLATAQMFWDQRLPEPAGVDLYRALEPIGERALADALLPDAGIWEFRNFARVHTFSAAMCWSAVRRLGLIAGKVGLADDQARWNAKAQDLREEILRRATHADGWIAGSFGGSEIDASLLLLPEIGLIPAQDPRFLRTLDVVERRLDRGGFLLRYDEADDFGQPHSAFLVCTFWYIDALVLAGRKAQALEIFNRLLSVRNHVGLLAEDVDPKTGALWGNFPQTYSHVGLILSAMRLSKSWEDGLWHAS